MRLPGRFLLLGELSGWRDEASGSAPGGGEPDTGRLADHGAARTVDLIGSESLGLLGAVMAVDDDGVLRGVVTVQQLRRAMQSALSPSA